MLLYIILFLMITLAIVECIMFCVTQAFLNIINFFTPIVFLVSKKKEADIKSVIRNRIVYVYI